MTEKITHEGETIAIIIPVGFQKEGLSFLTPPEYSLQMGFMSHPSGYKVEPHTHRSVQRETLGTQEVLFIKSGVIEVDFYSKEQMYLEVFKNRQRLHSSLGYIILVELQKVKKAA